MSAVITGVNRNSPAFRAGLRAGQTLLKVNGVIIRDVLDYKFYAYDARLKVEIREPDGAVRTVLIKKTDGEDPGVSFDNYLMDKARACSNKCIFCFIDQLPRGMRDTLYFKDDDARLSFLMGNYVSLTNLSAEDIDRIIRQRISPINISVHTTDPQLRAMMLGNPRGAEGISVIHRFAQEGICMKCQIVVCPGVNDGQQLKKSLEDLCALYPAVSSISVVPVGLTRFRQGLYPLRPVDMSSAREILAITDSVGGACLEKTSSRIAFCADELYLKAGAELPDMEYYEDFPQFENGVGMLTALKDEFFAQLPEMREPEEALPQSIATGLAACPTIKGLVDAAASKCNNMDCKVYGIVNGFLGESVDVAGLVCGADLIGQLRDKPLGRRLLIPATMLRHGGDVFLDDVTPEQVSEQLGVPVIAVPVDGGQLLDALFGVI